MSFLNKQNKAVEDETATEIKFSDKLNSRIIVNNDNDALTRVLTDQYLNNNKVQVLDLNYSMVAHTNNTIMFSVLVVYKEAENTLGNSSLFKQTNQIKEF